MSANILAVGSKLNNKPAGTKGRLGVGMNWATTTASPRPTFVVCGGVFNKGTTKQI